MVSFNEVTDTCLRQADRATLALLLTMYQERMVTIAEMAENARFFFEEPTMDPKAFEKNVKNNNGGASLQAILDLLNPVADWSKGGLTEPMDKILALGEKKGAAAPSFRVALSGGTVTPPLLETIALLGREKTLERIERALAS